MSLAYTGLAGLEVWSGLQQAESIRAQGELQKQLAAINEKYAYIDAYNAENDGANQALRYDTTISQTIGDQRTSMAAANIDVNFGTAAEIQEESKFTGFLNKIDILNQAQNKALGLRQQGRMIGLQSQMQGVQNSMAERAAVTSAVTSGAKTYLSGYGK